MFLHCFLSHTQDELYQMVYEYLDTVEHAASVSTETTIATTYWDANGYFVQPWEEDETTTNADSSLTRCSSIQVFSP